MRKGISQLKRFKLWLKQKLGLLDTAVIVPFSGYGDDEEAFFIGAVVEDRGLSQTIPNQGRWRNFLAMVKRFTADEMPGKKVKATFLGLEKMTETNQNGIFRFSFDLKNDNIILSEGPWIEIKLELPFEKIKNEATGKILLLKSGESSYGVISDIDDTIIVSHSFNNVKKLRLMLFKNAFTRMPFEGVAGFYRALHKGYKGNCHNPIFYVSSSQWNLFDLLRDFCNFRNIPEGVMLLQELKPYKPKKHVKKKNAIIKHAHKLDKIRSILETYQHLNFILIGDSGQKDAEIYQKAAHEFPGRVLAIYIRDVRKSRIDEVVTIGNALKHYGVDMLLIKDTVYAAQHAIEKKLINSSSLDDIVNEKINDHLAKVEI